MFFYWNITMRSKVSVPLVLELPQNKLPTELQVLGFYLWLKTPPIFTLYFSGNCNLMQIISYFKPQNNFNSCFSWWSYDFRDVSGISEWEWENDPLGLKRCWYEYFFHVSVVTLFQASVCQSQNILHIWLLGNFYPRSKPCRCHRLWLNWGDWIF